MPASLINMLLLRAGIHPNPGPTPGATVYYCCVCQKRLSEQFNSVQCSMCKQWCHLRKDKTKDCSKLGNIKKYKNNYTCPTCNNQPSPTQPTPTPAQKPTLPPVASGAPSPPPDSPPRGDHGGSQQPSPPTVASGASGPPPDTPLRGDIGGASKHNIKVLQFNCNGIRNKITEITKWLLDQNIMIAAFQETKLSTYPTRSATPRTACSTPRTPPGSPATVSNLPPPTSL